MLTGHRTLFLVGWLALSAVSALSQPWVNPGTTNPATATTCKPYDLAQAGPPAPSTAYYCAYVGTFPWFAAGGGWSTALRIAAPSSGAIEVKYLFRQLDSDGSFKPALLDYLQYGETTPAQRADATIDLNPNQPSELTLLGKANDGRSYTTPVTGFVYAEVRCPDKATCASAMPQLIHSSLPAMPWYLSGSLSSTIAMPTQMDSQIWSAAGINDPQPKGSSLPNQIISFVIMNDSISDQDYNVSVYDKTGTLAGSRVVSVHTGGNLARVLDDTFIAGLPRGLVKVRVQGMRSGATSISSVLQFSGPAATALLPVAEQ